MSDTGAKFFGWLALIVGIAGTVAGFTIDNNFSSIVVLISILVGALGAWILYMFLYEPARDEAMKDPTTAAKFTKRKNGWIIAIVVVLIIVLIGSCNGGGSSSKDGNLVTGTCSHCHGAGVTSYGKKCSWCNGTGVWAYYD